MGRELRRLETELNFLRTQPLAGRREPDLPGDAEPPDEDAELVPVAASGDAAAALAEAPVYHPDDADEDDPYSGGRAV
jgi:hypothetical protein